MKNINKLDDILKRLKKEGKCKKLSVEDSVKICDSINSEMRKIKTPHFIDDGTVYGI